MILLLESSLKVAVILLLALAFMPLLRRRAAALRHWLLAAAVMTAVAAPAIRTMVPAWQLPLDLTAVSPTIVVPNGSSSVEQSPVVSLQTPQGPPAADLGAVAPYVLGIWAIGAALGTGVLIVGLTRLVVLASAARRVSDGVWAASAEEIGREYNLLSPTVLQSAHPSLVVAWGVRRPRVLVPASALSWPAERVRIVLAHELAHIRRGDWLVQLAAELLRAIYWFNPLAWIACRRLRQESEQACDDAVINRGVEGSEYAAHLVNIARELHQRRTWVPAPAIARTSHLERRIRVMLDQRINRRPVSRAACAAALLALLAVVVPVTGAAVAQVFATVAGSIVDPANAAVPGVTLILTNSENQAKYEVRSDRNGRYEFVGLPAGEYLLEAKLPGFTTLQGKLTVAGQHVQRDLQLEIGSLQETIHISASRSQSSPDIMSPPTSGRRVQPRAAPTCDGAAGGNIRPPHKLYDVRPYYPASAVRSGISGTVQLVSRIGVDGTVEDVQVVSTPHPDLATAGTEAVRQWLFDATYLNCVAVPVTMKVTLNFTLEP